MKSGKLIAVRALPGVVGLGLIGFGLMRRGRMGLLAAAVGAALVMEAGRRAAKTLRGLTPSARRGGVPEPGPDQGRAPESGEPSLSPRPPRDEVFGVQGEEEGFAPESGGRMSAEWLHDERRVAESSEESFPASDAPSWTPGRV